MNGSAPLSFGTRRRLVGIAAALAMVVTASACGGSASKTAPTTKSRAERQREAAIEDGSLADPSAGGTSSGTGRSSGSSAAESVDSMRVAAVGKTRTDAAATAGASSAGSASPSAGGLQSASSTTAPKQTPSGSATTTPQSSVTPWSGISTSVGVTPNGKSVEFKATACNTTSRQRSIQQNRAAATVEIRSNDGAKYVRTTPGPAATTYSLGANECREVLLADAAWDGTGVTGTSFKAVVIWDAAELGTPFSGTFESAPFSRP